MSVKVSAKASAKAAVGVSVAAGTAVLVTAIGAGWVLSTVGVAIAFIPNQIGARVLLPTRIGWSPTCQQSNQWAIETLAMTQDPAEEDPASRTRAAAQACLRGHGYQPSVLPRAPRPTGRPIEPRQHRLRDHRPEKRFTDHIETVTVDSVFAWLNRSHLGGTVQVIR